ncbi:uncharacterized protein [Physcomitrium patens]|uniref:DUF1365-domain-containing protein n=1 Tax=Physcomitrium patens TaxID=3218 RepID=A0A2K1IXD4_PHYPA|nr:uncharacterized protein LOC112272663 [Physcomitrium patens]PNR33936.1 hypothetical protein PHYPA_023752 [Physcomitrium patens]|eukprot:XP_024356412.1 uncharacterized protein LOC112272663 [Physcomitrella patens]
MAPAEVEMLGRGSALAQLIALLCDIASTFCSTVARSLLLAFRILSQGTTESRGSEGGFKGAGGVEFYEGKVWHERRKPVVHRFEYNVRYAFIDLDAPPRWFVASHHMSASEARSIAGTSGPVWLLTMPLSVGYEQNPLSVYYCYDEQGGVAQCIAEVTNTPWAERVTFLFNPESDLVAKPLHVSPFMDMKAVWQMQAPTPGKELLLCIGVQHPELGNYFQAILKAKRVTRAVDPEAFTWIMPQKVAFWIYWQALQLMWKGVSFIPHPKYIDENDYRERAQKHPTHACPAFVKVDNTSSSSSSGCPAAGDGSGCPTSQRFCTWREAPGYPWR